MSTLTSIKDGSLGSGPNMSAIKDGSLGSGPNMSAIKDGSLGALNMSSYQDGSLGACHRCRQGGMSGLAGLFGMSNGMTAGAAVGVLALGAGAWFLLKKK